MLAASLEARRRQRALLAFAGLGLLLVGAVAAPRLVRWRTRETLALAPGDVSPKPRPGAESSGGEPSATEATPAARPGSTLGARATPALGTIHVGAKTFTEQYVLAHLLAARLAGAGLSVERHESLGSTVAFDALGHGDIDVYVEYTGTIWTSYMKRDAPAPGWRTLALASAWLAETHGVRLLGALGFENAYCLAMRRDRARELGVTSIADLAPRARELSLGSDYEFLQRAEWTRLSETYHLGFARTTSYDPSFMYEAVSRREVDLITGFSSDGRIDELGLVVLPDPAGAFPPYDAVLLLSPRVAEQANVVEALTPLLGALPVERMRQANQMVDRDADKRTPEQAAAWLLQFVEGRKRE